MNSSTRIRRRWTPDEDQTLKREAGYQLAEGPVKDWNRVAAKLPGRTNKDCRKRWSKISEPVKKGSWDADEDARLRDGVRIFGTRWTQVAQIVGTRQADQCAKRWTHSLDPSLDHSEWKEDEDRRLIIAVATHGRNWSQIAENEFPGRAKLALKNRYAVLKKKLNLDDSHGPGYSTTRRPSLARTESIPEERMHNSDESDSEEDEFSESTRPPSRTSLSNLSQKSNHDEFGFPTSDFHDMKMDPPMSLAASTHYLQTMMPMDQRIDQGPMDSFFLKGHDAFTPDHMFGDSAFEDSMITPKPSMSGNPFDMAGSSSHYGSTPNLSAWDQQYASSSDPGMGMPMSRYPSAPDLVHLSSSSSHGHSPSPSIGLPSRRTTMVLENVQEDTLSQVMNILFQAKAKVSMETTHQEFWPGMSGSG